MSQIVDALLAILRPHRAVSVVFVAVSLLAAVNWILSPDQALRSLRAMAVLPAVWLGLALWYLAKRRTMRGRDLDDVPALTRYAGSALAIACIAIGIRQIAVFTLKIWIALAEPAGDLEIERRILGFATCVMFVVIGNMLPKILTPFSVLPPDRAQLVTVARRFIGTTAVMLGLVGAFAHVAAPLAFASALLRGIALVFVLTTLGAIVWMNVSAGRQRA